VAAGGHPDKIGALAGHILRSARWADENLGLYLSQLQQKPAELLFTVDFAGDKRGFQEVMQHATAVHEAWGLALEYACELIRCEQEEAFARLREDEKAALVRALEEIKGCPQESWFSGQRRRQLLNEADVQRLHFMLAEDLLSEDCLVQPGQYRVDNRVVGFDVMFPSPDLVPECMARYVESSNELARQLRARPEIAIRVAARVSYDFVRIHPFPDFNGRLSRILLEMVLVQADCPFHVSLRADKIGRARYLKALTSANRGDLRPYETLIAMSVVDGFRNIDENLRAAGLPPLVAVGEGDD
jgi:fido (protein-threonine AMPylation protein)